MFVWSSQQSLPTQTQNLMEKNAIHSHKYSSVEIVFIKTSSFFKAHWSHWRCWCFSQPLCAPDEALKLMSSQISNGGQWSLRSISLTWNFAGHGLSCQKGHRMPSSNTSHGPPLTQSDVPWASSAEWTPFERGWNASCPATVRWQVTSDMLWS